MSTVYGNCIECGATPIDDRTELCEECEAEARRAGEFDDLDEEHEDWGYRDDPDFEKPSAW